MHFRRTLIQAAEKSHADGEISRGEVFKLRMATLLPRICDRLETACGEQAAMQGVLPAAEAADVKAIDWTTLLAFLKEMLPLILKLLTLFSNQES